MFHAHYLKLFYTDYTKIFDEHDLKIFHVDYSKMFYACLLHYNEKYHAYY